MGLCLGKGIALCSSKRDSVVFLCLLGMATCFFCTHPQLDPPVRTWTQLSLTLLLHTPPSLLPPPHHLPYPARTLHHRSQRMRLTSICPNRRERSTETETPSCESAFLSTLPGKLFLSILFSIHRVFSYHTLELLEYAAFWIIHYNMRTTEYSRHICMAFFVIVSQVPAWSHGEMCALRTFRGINLWSSLGTTEYWLENESNPVVLNQGPSANFQGAPRWLKISQNKLIQIKIKAHILFLISIVPLQLSFLYKNQGPQSLEKPGNMRNF